MAKIIWCTIDEDGRAIGFYNNNTILNMMVYGYDFHNGLMKQYATNTVDDNIIYQLDYSSNQYTIFYGILDYNHHIKLIWVR